MFKYLTSYLCYALEKTLVKNDTGLDDLKLRQQVVTALIPMEEPTILTPPFGDFTESG